MPWNNIISRADADVLIPEEVASDVVSLATQASVALTLCRSVTMSSKTKTMPVLSALPVAYWVQGDTGLKQTSEAAWTGIELVAEELATIVPVPEAVLERCRLRRVGRAQGPTRRGGRAQARSGGLRRARQARVVARRDRPRRAGSRQRRDDRRDSRAGRRVRRRRERDGLVEADGFDPTAIAARADFRRLIRQARSAQGDLLGEGSTTRVWDLPVEYFDAGCARRPGARDPR